MVTAAPPEDEELDELLDEDVAPPLEDDELELEDDELELEDEELELVVATGDELSLLPPPQAARIKVATNAVATSLQKPNFLPILSILLVKRPARYLRQTFKTYVADNLLQADLNKA